MRNTLTLAIATIALAACGSSSDADTDGDGTVSADEVEAAAAKVKPLEAGEYKMNMELVELVDPSMSPEDIAKAKEFMNAMANAAPARCLSEEEASKGMIGIAEQLQNGDCTMDSLTSDADGMQAAMTCKAGGGDAKITIDSQSTGTASEMTMTAVEPVAGSEDTKRVTMKVGMTRTGDCT